MAMDTPATVAIIGGGPLGIEAALYARYLGYDVEIYEQAEVGSGQLRRGSERLAGVFRDYCSALALQALEAQGGPQSLPAMDAELTLEQWVLQYLRPLAATDLVAPHVRPHARVIEVRPLTTAEIQSLSAVEPAVPETAAAEGETDEDWEEVPCEPLLVRFVQDGKELSEYADVVILAIGSEEPFACPGEATYLHRIGTLEGAAVSYRQGLQQIRELFATLADRPTLNLYR